MIEVASYHNQLLAEYQHLVDDPLMWLFTFVVVLDLILDLIKPYYIKTNSRNAFAPQSVLRNAVIYAVVAIGYPYLCMIGAEAAATAFLIAFVYQFAVWTVETWTEIGWWLPQWVTNFIKNRAEVHSNKMIDVKEKGGKK